MADKVQYAMSITPIEELTSSEDSSVHDILSPVTGKSLGGNNELDLTGLIDGSLGYNNGTVAYLSVTSGGVPLNADATDRRLILIKNTGFLYSDATTLGAVTTENFTVTVGAKVIAELGPGDVVVLPNAAGGAVDLECNEFTLTSDSSAIACEFLAVTL
ncbi:hypothetical protein HN803_06850 [candidate division WWE3 bacterium]|jgi:hypothetical protein|nr:hypothetical protein [candidate division WWE3 bacterium]